jgi:hypothetical protein
MSLRLIAPSSVTALDPAPGPAAGRATPTSRLFRRTAGRAGAPDGAAAENAVTQAATSSGTALPTATRARFEASLGTDLGAVRIHTGDESQRAASALGAQAYASGDDIHFAAGRYAPDDPFGLHLLAHEVAHTVQQRGASASPLAKLAVSGPDDDIERDADRAADSMVVGRATTVASSPSTIARKEEPKPYAGPTPDNDFDGEHLTPAQRAQVDRLSADLLRPLVQSHVVASYVAYTQASTQIQAKLMAKKEARHDRDKRQVEMVMGAVGMMLGPLLGPGLAAAVQSKGAMLSGSLQAGLGQILRDGGGSALTVTHAQNLAQQQIATLIAKATPEAAGKLVGGAATKVGSVVGMLSITNDDEDTAASYVDAMLLAADKSQSALLDAIALTTDPAALLATYGHFAGGNLAKYRVEIETKAEHFLQQIAPTLNPSRGESVVRVDAYGRLRLARVKLNGSPGLLGASTSYEFRSWITPDMEALALGSTPNPTTIAASALSGHIPDPVAEGEAQGATRIVRLDAWGRPRLAVVGAETSGWSGAASGKYHFVQWIGASEPEQLAARVRGASQIGGITDLDPARVKALPPPPPDPVPAPAAPAPAAQ